MLVQMPITKPVASFPPGKRGTIDWEAVNALMDAAYARPREDTAPIMEPSNHGGFPNRVIDKITDRRQGA